MDHLALLVLLFAVLVCSPYCTPAPEQVHISQATPATVRITWLTAKDAPSVVDYGTAPGSYPSTATGSYSRYDWLHTYRSGYIHEAILGPLASNTTYFYRLSSDPTRQFSLKTPPASLPITFCVVGDLGQSPWTTSTLNRIAASPYDMFLLPGDLSYAKTHQKYWDSFGRLVEPLASSRSWMVTEGNHEIETITLLQKIPFKAYNARWKMPFQESGSPSNLYYSFDAAGGAVHVLMLGSYAPYGPRSEQYMWLVKDLAKVDRKRTPWLIAVMHAPWYNMNRFHQGEGEAMRISMEKLLYDAGVDIVFAGHVHAYERFTRIYDNKADPCGPLYITIGDGGNGEGLAFWFTKKHKSRPLSLFQGVVFGHGHLNILDDQRAHWKWYRNKDPNTTAADEFIFESLASSPDCLPKTL